MRKVKDNPRYNVLSIRVTDEEKAAMDEMRRQTQKSVSTLIREALNLYTPNIAAISKVPIGILSSAELAGQDRRSV